MILLIPMAMGVVAALLRGGSLRRLADLEVRLGWAAGLCFLVQVLVAGRPTSAFEAEHAVLAALLLGSLTVLVAVVWVNRRTTGMPILALGLLLNFTIMAANGGFMPVSPEAILAAGTSAAADMPAVGARVPKSKDVLLPPEQTKLAFLSDVIVVPFGPAKVYSLGDLVVGLGAFVLIYAAMVPDRRARPGRRVLVDVS